MADKSLNHLLTKKRIAVSYTTSLQMKHDIREYCVSHGISQGQFIDDAIRRYFDDVGFHPEPIKSVDCIARMDLNDLIRGKEYDALRAWGASRHIDCIAINRMCHAKRRFDALGLSDEEVISHKSPYLLMKINQLGERYLTKSFEPSIRRYQDYLRYSRGGAVGDDLHCEKEAAA